MVYFFLIPYSLFLITSYQLLVISYLLLVIGCLLIILSQSQNIRLAEVLPDELEPHG